MLWYRIFASVTPSGRRLLCPRPHDLLNTAANEVSIAKYEHLTRQSACSPETENMQATSCCDKGLELEGLHLQMQTIHMDQTYSLSSLTASNNVSRVHASLLRPGTHTFDRAAHMLSQSDKPSQGYAGASLAPDISLLRPELQQQWHFDRNMHLGQIKVKPHSQIKAVWQCDKCPAGQPHVWLAIVSSRTQGAQCPYCTNRRVCVHNSLATAAPDMAQYWNHCKNERTPEQTVAGSHLRAHWTCPDCRWEWQAPVFMRIRNMSGCPKCSQQRRTQQAQPTFVEAQPACLAEWEYEHNGAENIHPENITLSSTRQVHWICSCCPRGQPHRWTAAPYSRIGKGRGCAVCAGKQACVCNSLQSLFPTVAAEFDADKNGFTASQITACSSRKVWWRNAKRGSWRQAVCVRTDKRLSRNQQV